MSAAIIAQLQGKRSVLVADSARVSARIATYEEQILKFEGMIQRSADPLFDPAEFQQVQGEIQTTLKNNQSPIINPSMVSAMSLVVNMATAAPSGPPAVIVEREEIRKQLNENSKEVLFMLKRSLVFDRNRLTDIQAQIAAIDARIG
ncbi:hypothetical protein BG015_011233 [Linnemannia schmuckeri]|uniref:Uncharacterized protein n=1 Tax=Linnemannia schmuckeri TaxID=64567 RepID=A0A9P5RVN7_9FUNG|nr:hypothetical protein BG015_011233 [Linnemannia schmuckeri]